MISMVVLARSSCPKGGECQLGMGRVGLDCG